MFWMKRSCITTRSPTSRSCVEGERRIEMPPNLRLQQVQRLFRQAWALQAKARQPCARHLRLSSDPDSVHVHLNRARAKSHKTAVNAAAK